MSRTHTSCLLQLAETDSYLNTQREIGWPGLDAHGVTSFTSQTLHHKKGTKSDAVVVCNMDS